MALKFMFRPNYSLLLRIRSKPTTCRCFSSESSSDSEQENEKKLKKTDKKDTNEKLPDYKTKAGISARLLEQILSMKVSSSVGRESADKGEESAMNLAKPSGKFRKTDKTDADEHKKDVLEPSVVSAVKEVADLLGGDSKKTESELLQKLKDHEAETEASRAAIKFGEMLTGMKIDRTLPKMADKRYQQRSQQADQIVQNGASRLQSAFLTDDQVRSQFRSRLPPQNYSDRVRIDLFGAQPLNIFTQKTAADTQPMPENVPKLPFWDKLEEKELKLLVMHPPRNAWEEMINWTEQGRLWKFPIDNEQGLDAESKVGFHEHVFLEKWISDFPKKGPIRHFMELIVVALSKNPYITVEQKKEHIDWFRTYFKDKEDLLKEIGALG